MLGEMLKYPNNISDEETSRKLRGPEGKEADG